MKKIENNFVVTGFVGKDAEIRQFTNASVARFPLAVSRLENNGEESKRVSAFMNFEAWRKNENTGSFDQLTKGTMLTAEGNINEVATKGGTGYRGAAMFPSGRKNRGQKGKRKEPCFSEKRTAAFHEWLVFTKGYGAAKRER